MSEMFLIVYFIVVLMLPLIIAVGLLVTILSLVSLVKNKA
jgi:hypothetical protein